MDVSALRTEIKTWERNFRAEHGREPSRQDIKEKPGLAEKYKEYKKLTKAAEQPRPAKPPNPPSTPPRTQSRDSAHPSLLLSKPRSIAAAQPLSGYNPFSPQKSKGKQKESSPDSYFEVQSFPTRTRSFPCTTHLSFRLRGEPVSPSPNKEKRRRIIREDSDNEDDEQSGANTSFVDDSPAKPPNGVRSFKLLFDEASAKPKFPLLRSKTAPSGLFGTSSLLAEGSEHMDIDEMPSRPVEKMASTASTIKPDDPFLGGGTASFSDDEMTDDRPLEEAKSAARSLLPPSPPPATRRPSGQPHLNNGKGRSKGDGQKATNISMSEDEDETDEDAQINRHKVRLFDRTAARGRVRDEDDADEDTYQFRTRRPPDADTTPSEPSESINLPDTLLSILSLAPTSSNGRQDEHVVEQLLYGARRGNYDPSKGGEIWGVGEFEDEERDEFAVDGSRRRDQGAYDDEDDWEGEGIPWEVGEL
ncbi:hypothetical protein DFH06DRAFT_1420455 [Mycena polygramma]|nr:hypothetical protein DFH06DRAFT_1420455 [Mycena polygramma]